MEELQTWKETLQSWVGDTSHTTVSTDTGGALSNAGVVENTVQSMCDGYIAMVVVHNV